jgi:hypothetical protein
MKSIVGTIIVFAVFGFAIVCTAPAQEASIEAPSGASVETTEPVVPIDIEPAATPPSKLPPSPPQFSMPAMAVPGAANELVEEPVIGESVYFNIVQPGQPGTTARSSSNVLVIPNTDIKAEDVAAITQDMQVMSHIFQKIFTGPRLIEGVFMDYGEFFGRGSRATQAIYLQGYGTLFLMEVNFPFSPTTKPKEKAEDTKEADSVWQRAKQEIFSPTRNVRGKVVDPENKYDAEKVEELKTRLIKALKHAANIRNIKSDEWIILTVIGEGGGYSGGVGSGVGGVGGYGGGYGGAVNVRRSHISAAGDRFATIGIVPGGTGVTSSTVLTIRAKKSDVDAFAKGELDYDKFREKVQILTYPSWGQRVVREVSQFSPALKAEAEADPLSQNNYKIRR